MLKNPDARVQAVEIRTDEAALAGDLVLPPSATAIVVFAHGSGSSRFSPRNRYVAGVLQEAGLGTLLMDLLSEAEERIDAVTAELRFDIPMLARRLEAATTWLAAQPEAQGRKLGYFGASTGAAAALIAAAQQPGLVAAVVSRGGRADLAGDSLASVSAPTLLIVGGADAPVIDMNRWALARLRCEKRLEIVPGATHLFEEPGTLEAVAGLARDWLLRHLG